MAIDRAEAIRRGATQPKTSPHHAYIGIEHRIVDSDAFADLKPNAKVILFLIARQLKKDNNGHLQATFSFMSRYGIGSEHTVKDSIAQLISHGFLYRTRSHGANGAWARYALTWLSVVKKENLFLAGFSLFAWRHWEPTEKKSTRKKTREVPGKNCSFNSENPAQTAGILPAKTADYESLLPCSSPESASEEKEQKIIPDRTQPSIDTSAPTAIKTELISTRKNWVSDITECNPESANKKNSRKQLEALPATSPLDDERPPFELDFSK